MLTKTVIENVFILLGEGFWLFNNFAQLKKLIRTRNTKGLLAPTQTLHAAGNLAWMTYFGSKRLWVPLSTNLGLLTLTTITIGYLLSSRKQFLKALISIVILGPIVAYVIIVYPGISGWTGMALNALAAIPWIYHVMTTKKTSGISLSSLNFGLGAILCTLTYAILIGSWPLIASCIQGLSFFLIIEIYYLRYRKAS